MAEGIFSGANILFAMVTQGISTGTSDVLGWNDDYNRDVDICKSIDTTTKSIKKMDEWIAKLQQTKSTQIDTDKEFFDIMGVVQREKEYLKTRKNTFMYRTLILIIANIFITAFIALRLLS